MLSCLNRCLFLFLTQESYKYRHWEGSGDRLSCIPVTHKGELDWILGPQFCPALALPGFEELLGVSQYMGTILLCFCLPCKSENSKEWVIKPWRNLKETAHITKWKQEIWKGFQYIISIFWHSKNKNWRKWTDQYWSENRNGSWGQVNGGLKTFSNEMTLCDYKMADIYYDSFALSHTTYNTTQNVNCNVCCRLGVL